MAIRVVRPGSLALRMTGRGVTTIIRSMSMRLQNKVAVITGGAQGIGRAIVEKFHGEGARVALLDIDEARGMEVERILGGSGDGVLFVRCDITREADVERAIAATRQQFDGLDILVNNAGVNTYFDATTMTESEWESVFAVDLKGAWLCAKHAIPLMRLRGGGSIVNIASLHAFMTTYGMFPYAAAKSGLVGLTRSMALDFGPEEIRVNAICPGWTRTQLVDEWLQLQPEGAAAEQRVLDQHPLRRMATPAEIANFVSFVASDEASFITGAALVIDGGLSARFAS
jgi:NAD(P)-dependent dehydrogenase (short-subunit alcohol dehydrogenase family)